MILTEVEARMWGHILLSFSDHGAEYEDNNGNPITYKTSMGRVIYTTSSNGLHYIDHFGVKRTEVKNDKD